MTLKMDYTRTVFPLLRVLVEREVERVDVVFACRRIVLRGSPGPAHHALPLAPPTARDLSGAAAESDSASAMLA